MIKIIQGNCLDKLKELPAESVDTCITSPPYFNLRDYQQTWTIRFRRYLSRIHR